MEQAQMDGIFSVFRFGSRKLSRTLSKCYRLSLKKTLMISSDTLLNDYPDPVSGVSTL